MAGAGCSRETGKREESGVGGGDQGAVRHADLDSVRAWDGVRRKAVSHHEVMAVGGGIGDGGEDEL